MPRTPRTITGVSGRPKTQPPSNAAELIEKYAEEGGTYTAVCGQLRIAKETIERWFVEFPELKEAFHRGKEKERQFLHSALKKAAMDGNITAAIFLLKSRHGYVEGEKEGQANRVNIQFNLPAAQPLKDLVVIEDESNSRTQRIPE